MSGMFVFLVISVHRLFTWNHSGFDCEVYWAQILFFVHTNHLLCMERNLFSAKNQTLRSSQYVFRLHCRHHELLLKYKSFNYKKQWIIDLVVDVFIVRVINSSISKLWSCHMKAWWTNASHAQQSAPEVKLYVALLDYVYYSRCNYITADGNDFTII